MLARNPSPLMSIASIILSMTAMAIGSGIMFTYVPFTLTQNDFPSWVAGAAVTAIPAGGFIGCLIAGPLIRRVGHARVFACFAAFVILGNVLVALAIDGTIWIFARFLYGIAANGIFIVTQSWLNHTSDNSWRGKAMSFFYMSYVLGLGVGALVFGQLPNSAAAAPLIAIMAMAIGILPIGLTRLPAPPAPERTSIDLRSTWKISPVGVIGIAASGGLSMLLQGFAPIYATNTGFGQSDVALLMFLMQLGMVVIQMPLGALSDRIDRRLVLIITFVLIAVMASLAAINPFTGLLLVALIFAIWSGATETVYSVAHAHANDRADPDDFVTLASTMLVVWSASAFVLPAAVTALTPVYGPKIFMFAVILIALLTAGFVVLRLTQRAAVPDEETENFGLRTAQAPNTEVYYDYAEGEDEEEPVVSLPS